MAEAAQDVDLTWHEEARIPLVIKDRGAAMAFSAEAGDLIRMRNLNLLTADEFAASLDRALARAKARDRDS